MLTDAQPRAAAKKFAAEWNDRGYEKGETHAFGINLLRAVWGITEPESFISFETPVWLGHTILEACALYPDCSLAALCDEATMPPELRKAHQANDKAVMKAYGYAPCMTEPEIVADLMKRYQKLTR